MFIDDKAKIIEEFVRDFYSDPSMYDEQEVTDFLLYNDLGIPLAQGICYNLIDTLTQEGRETIEETWNSLCVLFESDPEGEYEDLDDLILFGDEEE
jgi:hypothetical protein